MRRKKSSPQPQQLIGRIVELRPLFATLVLIAFLATPTNAVDSDEFDPAEFEAQLRSNLTDSRDEFDVIDEQWLLAHDGVNALRVLNKLRKSPDAAIELYAIRHVECLLSHSESLKVRHDAIEQLLDSMTDGSRRLAQRYCYRILSSTARSAFAKESIDLIGARVGSEDSDTRWIWLAGRVGITECVTELRDIAKSPAPIGRSRFRSRPWAAKCALARMGDERAVVGVIEAIENHPDRSYRVLSLLSYLSYVQQPETIELLIRYALSDEKLPGSPDAPGPAIATIALRELSKIVPDMPTNRGGLVNTPDEIREARRWILNNRKTVLEQPFPKLLPQGE